MPFKYCPKCKTDNKVKVLPPDWGTNYLIGMNYIERVFHYINGDDPVYYFKRKVKCVYCNNIWETAEVDEQQLEGLVDDQRKFLNIITIQKEKIKSLQTSHEKLIELQNALKIIKKNTF